MGRMKKAIVAGVSAGVATVVTGLSTEVPRTSAGWVALFGGALVAAVGAGWATYETTNTPAPVARY